MAVLDSFLEWQSGSLSSHNDFCRAIEPGRGDLIWESGVSLSCADIGNDRLFISDSITIMRVGKLVRTALLLGLCCWFTNTTLAQTAGCFDPAVPRQAVRDLGHYAVAIAKAPAKLRHARGRDFAYLGAFSAMTAALLLTDTRVSDTVSNTHEDRLESHYASNILLGVALGSSTIKYFVACSKHNSHERDDAVREWTAMGLGLASVGGLKYIFRRQRPDQLGSKGNFFDSNTSFPSGHAIEVWSLASVISYEYGHTKFVPIIACSLAGVVSAARFGARQHFASDILAGGAMGWFIGRYVWKTHQDHAIHSHSGLQTHFLPQIEPASGT